MSKQGILTAISAALSLLLLSLAVSCQKQDKSLSDEALADSMLKTNLHVLYANPHKADSIFASVQQQTTDSAVWHRIEIFRATAHRLQGDSLGAKKRFEEVERWCRRTPKQEAIEGQLWNHIGIGYAERGMTDSCLKCYERSFAALSRAEKSPSLISTSINLADNYQAKGDIAQSTAYYRYALYLCDSLHHSEDLASIYCGLAQIYADLNEFSLAHHYFNQARPLINREMPSTQTFYHMSLGNCWYFEKRYPEALLAFKQVIRISQQSGNKVNEFKAECNMAEVQLMQGLLPQAGLHLNRADSIAALTTDVDRQARFYLNSLKTDLLIARGKMPFSKEKIERRINTTGIFSYRYLMLHYSRLQYYAVMQGKWHEAYELQALTNLYADSLRGQQVTNHVTEITKRYERDTTLLSQRLALADYQRQNAQQNTLILTGVVLVLLLLLGITIAVWAYRRHMKHNLTKQMERITELRMDVVRNRVSPHYIFNVLNTILPKLSAHPDINLPLNLLIDVLRGNLLTSGHTSVMLKDELLLVKRFVQLHHISKGPWPEVEWNVDEGLAQSEILIPSMALQIPVENALKHAFIQPSADSLIQVEIKHDKKQNSLVLTVTDNGQGYNPGNIRSTGRDTGTGLRLLTRTFEILNKRNEHQALLTITNREAPKHGTIMLLCIPVDYSYE